MEDNTLGWLKTKGYLHITPQLDVRKDKKKLLREIQNPDFVSRYAFFPLLHKVIDERRYKRINSNSNERAHSYQNDQGEYIQNVKRRPLHYASHKDALIFGYYADILQKNYEKRLVDFKEMAACVTAYRRVAIETDNTNKSTIHFANEVFEEIKHRVNEFEECCVLTFDIKSFFSSLDHKLLKKCWADTIGVTRLSDDHYNVFKAATKFSYILLDDLRVQKSGRRGGYDEKDLARIRNKFGKQAFFDSPRSFREKVKNGEIKLHRFPFRKDGVPIGIPQGLPISAVLANIYLFDFDTSVYTELVEKLNCYYRRYSDDIVLVCRPEDIEICQTFIAQKIEESKVAISKDKTERFLFQKFEKGIVVRKFRDNGFNAKYTPLVYLGFEFNGKSKLLKSTNVSKFYRKMISSVTRKAKRAQNIALKTKKEKAVIYKRQLYKLFITLPLRKTKTHSRWKRLVRVESGEYRLKTGKKTKIMRSNYLTYVKRAATIMNEPAIERQVRKHKKIYHQAIERKMKKYSKGKNIGETF